MTVPKDAPISVLAAAPTRTPLPTGSSTERGRFVTVESPDEVQPPSPSPIGASGSAKIAHSHGQMPHRGGFRGPRYWLLGAAGAARGARRTPTHGRAGRAARGSERVGQDVADAQGGAADAGAGRLLPGRGRRAAGPAAAPALRHRRLGRPRVLGRPGRPGGDRGAVPRRRRR